MKNKWFLWSVAVLIGTVLAFPPMILTAEKGEKREKKEGMKEKKEEMREKMKEHREEMKEKMKEKHEEMKEKMKEKKAGKKGK